MIQQSIRRLVPPGRWGALCASLCLMGGIVLVSASLAQSPASSAKPASPPAVKEARIDGPVDDFTLNDIMAGQRQGQSAGAGAQQTPALNILKYKGDKVVVLFFMMEKCHHTVRIAPRIAELAAKYKDDVVFMGVRCNADDSLDALRKLVRKNKLAIPVLDDVEGSLSRYFRVRISPSFAIIDREGALRYFGGYDTDPGHSIPVPPDVLLPPAIHAVVENEDVRVKRSVPNGCVIRLPGSH